MSAMLPAADLAVLDEWSRQLAMRIREVRNSLGESQGVFASRFGAFAQSVSNWERGMNPPSTRHLIQIGNVARDLSRSDAWFFWGAAGLSSGPPSTPSPNQLLALAPERNFAERATFAPAPDEKVPVASRESTARKLVFVAARYWGICSIVARNSGRSVTHVSLVARGLRRSLKIERALQVEMRRVERESVA